MIDFDSGKRVVSGEGAARMCGNGADFSWTYQTRKDLRWTGGWGTFALGWQETIFEDVFYPWGILEISVGLLQGRDRVIGPQLRSEFWEDWKGGG